MSDEEEVLVGRLLRKRVFASFAVLDVVVVRKDTGIPQPVSVVIQAGGAGERVDGAFERARSGVRLGDVVAFTGAIEHCNDQTRGKLRMNANRAQIVDKWNAGSHGTLYFTKGEHANEGHELPQLIIQCPDSFVNRLICYISKVWRDKVRSVMPSTTHFSNTSERQLLVYCKFMSTPASCKRFGTHSCRATGEAGGKASAALLQRELLADKNLAGVIRRCYGFHGPSAAFTSMYDVVKWIRDATPFRHASVPGQVWAGVDAGESGESGEEGKVASARLQTFPKSLARWFMECWSPAQDLGGKKDEGKEGVEQGGGGEGGGGGGGGGGEGEGEGEVGGRSEVENELLKFDPKGFDVVLSIVFANGCLFASFQSRASVSIGASARHDGTAVCKAQVRDVVMCYVFGWPEAIFIMDTCRRDTPSHTLSFSLLPSLPPAPSTAPLSLAHV
jgi:hypothetical protein